MIKRNVSLAPFVTLRLGGRAEMFTEAASADQLANVVIEAHESGQTVTLLGSGSNVLPSDHGVPGLVIRNLASKLQIDDQGDVLADSGIWLQSLFLKTVQAGFGGLEYAVGIPGTLGGALVSNAGAYRSQISEYLTELDMVIDGQRRWVKPDWMEFAYRDSVLRRQPAPKAAIIRARFRLPKADAWRSYQEAREYQRQRISKQPPSPSAGSFFKNVNDHELAQRLDTLPIVLKEKGIVPAGFLIEAAGLRGHRHGGVGWGVRHANFMLNLSQGTATQVAELAESTIAAVSTKFGANLESEVLYLGDWSVRP